MPYSINRYNGTLFTTVEDGTINTVTELKFVGKNYAGYGEAQNENMLHLLENFASETPPLKPLSGMLWFDVLTNKIKYYDGASWRIPGGAQVSSSEPPQGFEGDIWWNSTTNQMYGRSAAGDWILVGPQATEFGTTQLISRIVLDISNAEHSIIEALITDSQSVTRSVFIISSTEFILNNTENPIEGFSTVKPGINLADRTVTGINYGYWGTVENADKLGGVPAAGYQLKSDIYEVPTLLTVGNSLEITVEDDDAIVNNVIPNSSVILSIAGNTILNVNNVGLVPGQDNVYDIGSPTKRWKTVYAVNVEGSITRSDSMLVGTVYFNGSVDAIPNTIAARDSNANLRANLFQGTATTARYADLAEKYTVEKDWPVGTAMAVCKHGEHETCPATASDVAIGVISENPAHLMNADLEGGQAIGLKGRVPVRVTGPVKKGQAVYAWNDGICSTIATSGFVGVALETNLSNDEKLVECVLKV